MCNKILTQNADVTEYNMGSQLGPRMPQSSSVLLTVDPKSSAGIKTAYVNLIGDPENMAGWTPVNAMTVSSNVAAAPDGSLTADRVIDTSTNTAHYISKWTIPVVVNTTYTVSVFAKAESLNQFMINTNIFGGRIFDLTTGTTIATGISPTSWLITPANNGWYRCSITSTASSTNLEIYFQTLVNSNGSYIGGSGTMLFWGAMLAEGTLQDYVPQSAIANTNQLKVLTSPLSTVNKTSITSPSVVGQAEYTAPGTYSWTAPAGVNSVSVVAVGAGASASGYFGPGGGGGALAWKNNISVVPGQSYTVVVGAGGVATGSGTSWTGVNGGLSSFSNGITSTIAGGGAVTGGVGAAAGFGTGGVPSGSFDGGGSGGGSFGAYSNGTNAGANSAYYGSGGGGAGGYSGNGGTGGGAAGGASNGNYVAATNGSGGGGGGGQGQPQQNTASDWNDGGGGGVGIYGEGASGLKGQQILVYGQAGHPGGYGGSGGNDGANPTSPAAQSPGGNFGAGGGSNHANGTAQPPGPGAGGAVRIIWGGGRSYPANAANASAQTATTSQTVSLESAVASTNVTYNSGYLEFFGTTSSYTSVTNVPTSQYLTINTAIYLSNWTTASGTFLSNADIDGTTRYQLGINNASYLGNVGAIFKTRLTNLVVSYSRAAIAAGWHILTATFDGTNARLYIDGTLVATTASASATVLDAVSYNTVSFGAKLTGITASEAIAHRLGTTTILNQAYSNTDVSTYFANIRGRYGI